MNPKTQRKECYVDLKYANDPSGGEFRTVTGKLWGQAKSTGPRKHIVVQLLEFLEERAAKSQKRKEQRDRRNQLDASFPRRAKASSKTKSSGSQVGKLVLTPFKGDEDDVSTLGGLGSAGTGSVDQSFHNSHAIARSVGSDQERVFYSGNDVRVIELENQHADNMWRGMFRGMLAINNNRSQRINRLGTR